MTTIYVTHDQAEAMTLADKLIVRNAGRVRQMGKPEEIYRRPANRFVASFIGSPPMNFVGCRYDPEHGTLGGAAFEIPVPARWRHALRSEAARSLILGI